MGLIRGYYRKGKSKTLRLIPKKVNVTRKGQSFSMTVYVDPLKDVRPHVHAVFDKGDRVKILGGKGEGEKGSIAAISKGTGRIAIRTDSGDRIRVDAHQIAVIGNKHVSRARDLREGKKLPKPDIVAKKEAERAKNLSKNAKWHIQIPGKKAYFTGNRQEFPNPITYDGMQWIHNGEPVSKEMQARIRAYGIPPAWRNVYVNPDVNASLRVVGYDDAGRAQRKYAPWFSSNSDQKKFQRQKALGKKLPLLLSKMKKGVNSTKPKVREAWRVLFIIYLTGMRPSMKRKRPIDQYPSFGAVSLLRKHVKIEGNKVTFKFPGKSNRTKKKDRQFDVFSFNHATGAAIIKEQLKGKGPDDFVFPITQKRTILRFLKKIRYGAGPKDYFVVKDLRTLRGTVLAANKVKNSPTPKTPKEAKRLVRSISEYVGSQLNNTWSKAFGSYINPMVWNPIKEKFPDAIVTPAEKNLRKEQKLHAKLHEEREYE